MKTNLILGTLLGAAMAAAQVTIPDGTRIRVRLEQNLSSETVELGQQVDFAVTQEIRVGDAVVIANGARATGNIVMVEPKRRLGRAGRLDFTIERVQMVDGNWLNVRYTPQKNAGKGNALKTGLLTAGIGIVFLPAAPLGLLVKGKEATIIRGRAYDVFSDDTVYVAHALPANAPAMARAMPQAYPVIVRQSDGAPVGNAGLPAAVNTVGNPMVLSNASMTGNGFGAQAGPPVAPQGQTASVNINASVQGAEIEVDGMFVGSAPTSVQLTAGVHKITVRSGNATWQRDIQVTGGTINVHAALGGHFSRASRQ